ncbi:hypothetical protein AB1E18_010834 [Capra hircus]
MSGTQDSCAGLPALTPPGPQGLASPGSHSFLAPGPDLCLSRLSSMQAFLFLVRLVGLLSLTSRFLVTSVLQGLPESVVQALLRPSSVSERLVGLQVRGSNFTLGNTPFLILSGTIHYFRVPRDYWKDSLLKLKACGFNTVTTAFMSLAAEVDLWVILCVGPYVGSDLDLGGLPSWLLEDSHMKLRTTHKGFTAAVNRYFDDLIPRIRGFQFQEEGPIIAVQMENEYGSYNLDKRYMLYIKNHRVFQPFIFDFSVSMYFSVRHSPHEEHKAGNVRTALLSSVLMASVREMLQLRFSLNFYMFHGGTNFGFMGGAAFRGHRLPMVTSYGKSRSEPVRSTGPLSMEQLSVNEGSGQSAGYILYETVITRGGVLNSDGHVKDRGQRHKEFLALRILVENQGRLASGTSMNQERKGLTGNIYLNGSPLRKFKIYSLEMQNKFIQRKLPNIWKPSFLHTEGPAFFLALLRVGSQPKDTFMSLQGWTKGVVFINGQNLGRYWNLGPQETLYVPGPWLKPGLNEIVVFEEFKSTLLIYFTNASQLGKAKGFREKRPEDCLIFQSLKRDFSSQDFRSRFDWSHLTPRELQNRSWGIQTEERAGRNPYFTLEGREFLILGGSIHYFRVPRASWRDRLLKLRACGFNTVTTYVPWNLHEPERGTFDFSGNLDLDSRAPRGSTLPRWTVRLLASGGFALRDGCVCSPTEEQDPHPAGDLGLLRSCCRLLTESRRVFTDPHKACPAAPPGTGPKAPGHWTRGWTQDPAPPAEPATPHPSWLLQDPTSQLRTTNHSFVNAVNKYFDHLIPRVAPLQYRRGGPIIAVQVENEYGFFYKDKAYMPYLLQALQQRGIGGLLLTADNTEEVTRGHIKGVRPLPPVPSPTPKVVYPSLKLSHYLPLWEALPYLQRPVTSNVPINMENLPINNGNGQSFGFVLYEMTVCSGGRLHANAQDEAQVFLNETSLGILTDVHRDIDIPPITVSPGWHSHTAAEPQASSRAGQAGPLERSTRGPWGPSASPLRLSSLWDSEKTGLQRKAFRGRVSSELVCPHQECQLLRILVENQGRVSFSWKIQNQRKDEGPRLMAPELHSAPWRPLRGPSSSPAFYLGTLMAGSSPQDTFLQLLGWNHGCVFINGRNLGRYWNIGPQEALYLPGSWLQPGTNEIVLFEKEKRGSGVFSTDVRRFRFSVG